MNIREDGFLFDCGGDELVGIIAAPQADALTTGVLVVVGGPQYRVGSHRQFTLLARHLAAAGIPCMRFDYRGMGDATGAQRDFEAVGDDIRAALDVFMMREPGLARVMLWGLCDGASAACFYAPRDPRVGGVVLLNPWVKTAVGEAKVLLRHYYMSRLVDPAFWKKLLHGGVAIGQSLGGLLKMAHLARGVRAGGAPAAGESGDLPHRMARSLGSAGKPVLVLLSGRDYVAREFEQAVVANERWQRLIEVARLERLDPADHTFSSASWREWVGRLSCSWVLENAVHEREGHE